MVKFRKTIVMLIILIFMFVFMPKVNAASLTIAFSKSTANVGDTVTVTVNGSGIAGKVALSVSGNATLNQNSVWVDNSSASATVTIKGTGTVTVTATPTDVSDTSTATAYTTATAGTITVANPSTPNGGNTNSNAPSEGDNPTTTTKSNVATLSNLGIRPNDFSGFRANTFSYNVQVPNETTSIEVYASKGQAGQTISGTGTKTLKEGANSFNVVVTAEDGKTQKTYTINVNRKAKEDKPEEPEEPEQPEENTEENTEEEPLQATFGLKELNIEGLELNPIFQSNVYEYRIELKEDLDKLDISTLGIKEGDDIEITGNENLQEGENVITIIVKGENEAETVAYQIIVNKTIEKPEEALGQEEQKLDMKKIIILSVAGGLVFIVVVAIIVIKVRKLREDDDGYIPYENVINNNYKDDYEDKKEENVEEKVNDNQFKNNDNYEKDIKYKLDEFFEEEEEPKKRNRSKGKRFK